MGGDLPELRRWDLPTDHGRSSDQRLPRLRRRKLFARWLLGLRGLPDRQLLRGRHHQRMPCRKLSDIGRPNSMHLMLGWNVFICDRRDAHFDLCELSDRTVLEHYRSDLDRNLPDLCEWRVQRCGFIRLRSLLIRLLVRGWRRNRVHCWHILRGDRRF
jgi:hypothetical protein